MADLVRSISDQVNASRDQLIAFLQKLVQFPSLPGFEQNGDLGQTLRRSGWNVLIFHYRGAWGSGGTFSFANCLEDVQAVRRPDCIDHRRVPAT